jgi:AsmA-like C-terminal region
VKRQSTERHAEEAVPPGEEEVVKRIQLSGKFQLQSAEFTSDTVQSKIETLSMRSRGIHDESANEGIVSNMQGSFSLSRGSIRFSSLSFSVPGANVQLQGHYELTSEQLNFQGTLSTQAKVSETQTGIKSLLLKLVDPFFKKGKAGAVLPIKITGHRSKPEFGLNLGGPDRD